MPTASSAWQDIRFRVAYAIPLIAIYVVVRLLHLSAGFQIIGAFFVLAGAYGLGQAYYRGTSLLFPLVPARYQLPYQVFITLLAWTVGYLLLSPGASLARYPLSWTRAPWTIGFAAFVGWLASAAFESARPRPVMRAYLMAVTILAVLCTMWRSGERFGGDDDDFGSSDQPIDSPQTLRDRALFNYVLYTGASFCGIAIAVHSSRHLTTA